MAHHERRPQRCGWRGFVGKAPAGAAKPAYGYQVPYAERILQAGQADLVALAREMLYNPNWAMDAAQKLGVDPAFTLVPPASQYWLERRAVTVPEVRPSTFG